MCMCVCVCVCACMFLCVRPGSSEKSWKSGEDSVIKEEINSIYLFSVCVCKCHSSCVTIRTQFVRVCPLLPPYGSQRLNSYHQAWPQAPLYIEPSHKPNDLILGVFSA